MTVKWKTCAGCQMSMLVPVTRSGETSLQCAYCGRVELLPGGADLGPIQTVPELVALVEARDPDGEEAEVEVSQALAWCQRAESSCHYSIANTSAGDWLRRALVLIRRQHALLEALLKVLSTRDSGS